MSKDRNENILQESSRKLDRQEEEEEGFEKDGEEEDEEEEAVVSRKDDDEEEEDDDDEAVASRKDDFDDEVEEEVVVEECKTPSSSDHKIPVISSCPPTPRKKTMMSLNSHKRKFSELQFFETTRSEEVESFFRSNSEPFSTNNTATAEPHSIKKKRCRSV